MIRGQLPNLTERVEDPSMLARTLHLRPRDVAQGDAIILGLALCAGIFFIVSFVSIIIATLQRQRCLALQRRLGIELRDVRGRRESVLTRRSRSRHVAEPGEPRRPRPIQRSPFPMINKGMSHSCSERHEG